MCKNSLLSKSLAVNFLEFNYFTAIYIGNPKKVKLVELECKNVA